MKKANTLNFLTVLTAASVLLIGASSAESQPKPSKGSAKKGSSGAPTETADAPKWPTTPNFSEIEVVYPTGMYSFDFAALDRWITAWKQIGDLSTKQVRAVKKVRTDRPCIIWYQPDTDGKGEKAAQTFLAMLEEQYGGGTSRPSSLSPRSYSSQIKKWHKEFPARVLEGSSGKTRVLWVPKGVTPDDFSAAPTETADAPKWPTTPNFSEIEVVYPTGMYSFDFAALDRWITAWKQIGDLSTKQVRAVKKVRTDRPCIIWYQPDTDGKGAKAAQTFLAMLEEQYGGGTSRPSSLSPRSYSSQIKKWHKEFPARVLEGSSGKTRILWVPKGVTPDDFSAAPSE